jgi:hypothetical protein
MRILPFSNPLSNAFGIGSLAFQQSFQGLCNQRPIQEMILGTKLSPLVLVFILHHISTSMRWKNQWGRILYCRDVIPKETNH